MRNTLVINKFNRFLMIKLLIKFGEEQKKTGFFNASNLNNMTNDELFQWYNTYYYGEEEPEIDEFQSFKNEFLINNPQYNRPKNINHKQAKELIIFYYTINNIKSDAFLSKIKNHKIKINNLRTFIMENIQDPSGLIDLMIKTDINNSLERLPILLNYIPNYEEYFYNSNKKLKYNIKF
jgi:hypothetical protein